MAKKRKLKSAKPPAALTKTPIDLAKVCRLCEMKDGPFLNIFENDTDKKIEQLLPIVVAENDELPHKICFRCSAKVVELYEFVQKCIKTQDNLYKDLGKKCPFSSKFKPFRILWEDALSRSNLKNNDICEEVIKKRMEVIKNLHTSDDDKSLETKEIKVKPTKKATVFRRLPKKRSTTEMTNKGNELNVNADVGKASGSKELKNNSTEENSEKCDVQLSKRSLRSNIDESLVEGETTEIIPTRTKKSKTDTAAKVKIVSNVSYKVKCPVDVPAKVKTSEVATKNVTLKFQEPNIIKNINVKQTEEQKPPEKKEDAPYHFNVMDHISRIKVNGVGVLFQCKLCNRNFLTKDIVQTHGCAKRGVAKVDYVKTFKNNTEPPKIPNVKYINTKLDKLPGLECKKINSNVGIKRNDSQNGEGKSNKSEIKLKPRIGPASKVKRISDDILPESTAAVPTESNTAKPPSTSSNQYPIVPSLSCKYKLVPGPNNTFSLVEAHPTLQREETVGKDMKRKSTGERVGELGGGSVKKKVLRSDGAVSQKTSDVKTEIIDLDDDSEEKSKSQPYPVGFFQTVSSQPPKKPPTAQNIAFATTALKRQSYTIVQTGHPNKLLISAKPQVSEEPKKKQNPSHGYTEQPYAVSLKDNKDPKGSSSFFTFINVDPLLQPSYVLPTDNNTIQESQIATSPKQPQIIQNPSKTEQYPCNMCNATFSREQKFLAHMHSHYNQIYKEDQTHLGTSQRKRAKKQ